ncbi:MAG: DUF167 domain-containing protein [Candidatus Aenigmatarchaeota archaeon]
MLVNIRVKCNQKGFVVEKIDSDNWVISLKSTPKNNIANREIIKELSKSYKSVRIIKGLKSRNKIIEVM